MMLLLLPVNGDPLRGTPAELRPVTELPLKLATNALLAESTAIAAERRDAAGSEGAGGRDGSAGERKLHHRVARGIGHPDIPAAIDGNSLRAGKTGRGRRSQHAARWWRSSVTEVPDSLVTQALPAASIAIPPPGVARPAPPVEVSAMVKSLGAELLFSVG